MRRATLAAALLGVAAVAGCSSDDQAATGSSPTDPSAAASSAAAVGWSPCDGLDAATVTRYAGQGMAEQNGTAEQPRCTFTPVEEGGPAFDVSYLWFAGGLDEALDAMGAVGTQLEPVDVPGAESARVAVRARRSGVLVTGFVQSDGLVQSVNAAQLRPYDEEAVVRATTELLAALARAAPSAGESS